jgi:molybdenum cofactor cytidylyltransferase
MTVAGLLLAAGRSRRFGADKLAALLDGEPIARRSYRALAASGVAGPMVVTGDAAAGAVMFGPQARLVINPAPENGLSSSLRLGLAAIGLEAEAIVVALADMPLVQAETIARLAAAIQPGDYAAVPVLDGQWGNPVALGREAIADAMQLTGDRGARGLLSARQAGVRLVATQDRGVLHDIDTPADLAVTLTGRDAGG